MRAPVLLCINENTKFECLTNCKDMIGGKVNKTVLSVCHTPVLCQNG